jgi:hypothetical protein
LFFDWKGKTIYKLQGQTNRLHPWKKIQNTEKNLDIVLSMMGPENKTCKNVAERTLMLIN